MIYILISIVVGLIFGLVFKLMLPRYFPNTVLTLVIGAIGATIGGFGVLLLKMELFGAFFLSAILATVFLVIDGALRKQNDDADEIHQTQQFILPPPLPARELLVKTCPACRRTYTDISLNFCLDDGAPLSSVQKILAHGDPDDTISFSNRRNF